MCCDYWRTTEDTFLVRLLNKVLHSIQKEVLLMRKNRLIEDPRIIYANRAYFKNFVNTSKVF